MWSSDGAVYRLKNLWTVLKRMPRSGSFILGIKSKSQGLKPGIEFRWCHWGFFPWYPRQNHVTWGPLSLWKWVPGISPGVKAAGAYGWRPTTLVVPNVKKIRGLNLPGTPWATSACCGMTFTFTLTLIASGFTSSCCRVLWSKTSYTQLWNEAHWQHVHMHCVIDFCFRIMKCWNC